MCVRESARTGVKPGNGDALVVVRPHVRIHFHGMLWRSSLIECVCVCVCVRAHTRACECVCSRVSACV